MSLEKSGVDNKQGHVLGNVLPAKLDFGSPQPSVLILHTHDSTSVVSDESKAQRGQLESVSMLLSLVCLNAGVHQVYMDGTSFMISSMEADGPADR